MGELSSAERELVAIGAALASNCVPCIEFHIPEARKAGLSDQQINEAVGLADKVRQVPAQKVLAAAGRLLPQAETRTHAEQSACGAALPATEVKPCCD